MKDGGDRGGGWGGGTNHTAGGERRVKNRAS